MLRIAGVEIEEREEKIDWMQIPFPIAPKILLEPGFALTLQDLRDRFKGKTKISAESTIVLGAGAASQSIENLTIDGTLKANEPINFFKHFTSKKIKWQPVTATDCEALRIRGYKVLAEDDE